MPSTKPPSPTPSTIPGNWILAGCAVPARASSIVVAIVSAPAGWRLLKVPQPKVPLSVALTRLHSRHPAQPEQRPELTPRAGDRWWRDGAVEGAGSRHKCSIDSQALGMCRAVRSSPGPMNRDTAVFVGWDDHVGQSAAGEGSVELGSDTEPL
ncbi:hypothetical protein TNCT1_35960 [Streptomyces sp. 1-11]|nr:hypothetical protein TNCT1_35960 [Streptomyces sp. 1-11]